MAYNKLQCEYLVVWQYMWFITQNNIYARRVSSTGGLITSSFSVAKGGYSRRNPAVAFNALNGEYLVVYMYDASGDGVHWEVWGRRVVWNGDIEESEFQIFTWANRAFYDPRVVWNSYRNQYLVVANALDTTTYKFNDVVGRRVMADGTTPYPGGSISSQSQTLQPYEADVTYNVAADEYLVVWRGRWTDYDWDIWGARVRGDNGAVVNPPGEFKIDASGEDQAHPAVATEGQERYLVVWQNGSSTPPTTDWNIYGRELDIAGNPAGAGLYHYTYSSDSEVLPDVVMNWATEDRLVVYRRTFAGSHEEIWGSMYGPMAMRRFQIAPDAAPFEDSPVVAAGNAGYLIVYDKFVSGTQNIYGRLYGLPAVYLPIILGQFP